MSNLTLAVDAELLKKARLQALEQGTSVNALVREYLQAFVSTHDRQREAVAGILARAEKIKSRSSVRRWTRDQLYDR